MATPPAKFVMDIVSRVQEQMQLYTKHSCQHQVWQYDWVTLDNFMRYLPDVDDVRTVDLVLHTCLQSFPLSCACLAAVRYDRVDMLLCSAVNLVPELEIPFWGEALQYLVNNNCWQSIQALLARGTGRVCWNQLGEKAAVSFGNHPAAVAVFDTLAARCLELECSCLGDMVSCVAWRGSVHLFKTLVNSENATVRQSVLDNVCTLVFHTYVHRQSPVTHLGSDLNGCLAMVCDPVSDLNDCLVVACQAGLFTTVIMGQSSLPYSAHHTVMGAAVCFNQPDLVQFLYHAGATNSCDLLQLSRDPVLEVKAKVEPSVAVLQSPRPNEDYPTITDKDAAQNIQGFLWTVASTPRSLESQCLLQVNRHLGWGHGRESKIKQLNISNTLKNALRFKDLKEYLKYPSKK